MSRVRAVKRAAANYAMTVLYSHDNGHSPPLQLTSFKTVSDALSGRIGTDIAHKHRSVSQEPFFRNDARHRNKCALVDLNWEPVMVAHKK